MKKLNGNVLGFIGLGLTLVAGIITNISDDKKREEEINEAVDKRFAELSAKEES